MGKAEGQEGKKTREAIEDSAIRRSLRGGRRASCRARHAHSVGNGGRGEKSEKMGRRAVSEADVWGSGHERGGGDTNCRGREPPGGGRARSLTTAGEAKGRRGKAVKGKKLKINRNLGLKCPLALWQNPKV